MLVGASQDYTSTDPTLNPPLVEGQANPMRRDVVQVPSMGSVTLRLVADNPGVWFFHCELSWSNVRFVRGPEPNCFPLRSHRMAS
jgi:iron transport multicopper oxidase